MTRLDEQERDMETMTRRGLVAGIAGMALVAGCGNGINSSGAAQIDARVDATLNYLFSNYPSTQDLRDKSAGILVMPLMTEAGLIRRILWPGRAAPTRRSITIRPHEPASVPSSVRSNTRMCSSS